MSSFRMTADSHLDGHRGGAPWPLAVSALLVFALSASLWALVFMLGRTALQAVGAG